MPLADMKQALTVGHSYTPEKNTRRINIVKLKQKQRRWRKRDLFLLF